MRVKLVYASSRTAILAPTTSSSFPTDRSKVVSLLQYFLFLASVISYVAMVVSFFSSLFPLGGGGEGGGS